MRVPTVANSLTSPAPIHLNANGSISPNNPAKNPIMLLNTCVLLCRQAMRIPPESPTKTSRFGIRRSLISKKAAQLTTTTRVTSRAKFTVIRLLALDYAAVNKSTSDTSASLGVRQEPSPTPKLHMKAKCNTKAHFCLRTCRLGWRNTPEPLFKLIR